MSLAVLATVIVARDMINDRVTPSVNLDRLTIAATVLATGNCASDLGFNIMARPRGKYALYSRRQRHESSFASDSHQRQRNKEPGNDDPGEKQSKRLKEANE
jgi:hypothetical protein